MELIFLRYHCIALSQGKRGVIPPLYPQL